MVLKDHWSKQVLNSDVFNTGSTFAIYNVLYNGVLCNGGCWLNSSLEFSSVYVVYWLNSDRMSEDQVSD